MEKFLLSSPSDLLSGQRQLLLYTAFSKTKQKLCFGLRFQNPMLGDVAPGDMIKVGRFKKLQKFIQTALEDVC
jgi:hypothetical protein